MEASLQNNDLSLAELNKVLALNKALDGGKVEDMADWTLTEGLTHHFKQTTLHHTTLYHT